VYGIIGFKTHTKATLIVRQESPGLRCYAHIGTGNYHPGTARLYTDLGLFTDAPDLTEELVEMFHYLTGRSMKRDYKKLLVAPVNMKQRFIAMVGREVDNHKAGKPAHIIAKMNSLEDRDVCQALYSASSAGVAIDLIVRGFCCLRAGVPGLSENIRVVSIIGRFLEHSRIFYFRNAAEAQVDGEFYIGSADWMHRNLHARIELATPIERAPHKERIWENLQIMLQDRRQAWLMQPDGTYVLMRPETAEQEEGAHDRLMRLTRQRSMIVS
jgi:polyphosphate kinase